MAFKSNLVGGLLHVVYLINIIYEIIHSFKGEGANERGEEMCKETWQGKENGETSLTC